MSEEEPIVYVVDDEAAIRHSLSLLLDVHGIRSATYASPFDFLDAEISDNHGCLVLDARMPGMTGLELLDHLQSRGWNMPVFLITGHGDDQMLEAAQRRGVVRCFSKPFNNENRARPIF